MRQSAKLLHRPNVILYQRTVSTHFDFNLEGQGVAAQNFNPRPTQQQQISEIKSVPRFLKTLWMSWHTETNRKTNVLFFVRKYMWFFKSLKKTAALKKSNLDCHLSSCGSEVIYKLQVDDYCLTMLNICWAIVIRFYLTLHALCIDTWTFLWENVSSINITSVKGSNL